MSFEPVLTKHIGVADKSIDAYRKRGGYQTLKKALSMAPEAIQEMVKSAGLRGRGGAGFPTGMKWSFMPKEPTKERPNYLVVNADESEPGTFKDRLLMEEDPHLLIESYLCSAWAIRASMVFVYIRGEYTKCSKVSNRAIAEAEAAGILGDNVMGSGWSCRMVVHRGAGAYICGEETALLDSLEGGRGNPRLKPPFPAQHGVNGMPTTVNNVETLACVPFILERGVDWFKSIGRDERNTGPKLYSVSGHVKRPGNYETAMGIPFQELLEEYAGGMLRTDRPLKALIPGGSSVPVLTAAETAGLYMDFDSVAKAGSMLGSAAVIVMDQSTDMVRALQRLAHFYHHESCGQCTPCREGTGWLERILTRIIDGHGSEHDLLTLDTAAQFMMGGTTICALSDAAAMPVRSFLAKFRPEFERYIKHNATATAALPRAAH